MNSSRGRGRPKKVSGSAATGGVLRRAKDMYGCLQTLASMSGGRARLVEWDEETFSSLQIELFPDDGPYKGGTFQFKINLEHDEFKLQYPRDPPVVMFTGSGFLHPNVDPRNGRVCMSLLHHDSWNASQNNLDDVINGLMYIMYNPNFGDPLWGSRTSWRYTDKRGKFEEQARKAMEGEKVRDHQFDPVKTADSEDPLQGRPCVADCEGTGPVKQMALVNKVTSGLVHALGCDSKCNDSHPKPNSPSLHKACTFPTLNSASLERDTFTCLPGTSGLETKDTSELKSDKQKTSLSQQVSKDKFFLPPPSPPSTSGKSRLRTRPARSCSTNNKTQTSHKPTGKNKPYSRHKGKKSLQVATGCGGAMQEDPGTSLTSQPKQPPAPQRLSRSQTFTCNMHLGFS